MSDYVESSGATDEWFTPPEIFAALGVEFDVDVACPTEGRAFLSVPTARELTREEDGLSSPWSGLVWMNPPFGKRNGHVPWLRRFVEHSNGIGLVRAYTSSGWFHDWMPRMDALCFPRGKTRFICPDGSRGGCPTHGVVLFALGPKGVAALADCGLGLFVDVAGGKR